MSNPVISVIVPVYNAEGTISRCVDSILMQSFQDFELILVDDGSTDGSAAKCLGYSAQDSRVKYYKKRNGGVSSCRNKGLDLSCGQYVCFADADDYVLYDWLETLLCAVCKYPESLIIQNVIIEEPSRVYLRYDGMSGLYPIETIWRLGNWGYSWNKIYRKDIIDKQGLRFDESLRVFEDELFVASYSSQLETAFVLPKVGYYYLNTVLLGDRYRDYLNFKTMSYLYDQVKSYNRRCSYYLVDRVVVSGYWEMRKQKTVGPIVGYLKDNVGKDISFVYGRKKLLIRLLSNTDMLKIWEFVFKLYCRFNLI